MRPSVPLLIKTARALGMTADGLSMALEAGASESIACWIGKTQVFHDGRPRRTLRLCYELMTGNPPPKNERFRDKLCPIPGCLNIHHYRLRRYVTWQEKAGIEPVPEGADTIEIPPEMFADDEETDLEIALWLIGRADGGIERTPESYHEQASNIGVDIFRRALDQVRAEEAALWGEGG